MSHETTYFLASFALSSIISNLPIRMRFVSCVIITSLSCGRTSMNSITPFNDAFLKTEHCDKIFNNKISISSTEAKAHPGCPLADLQTSSKTLLACCCNLASLLLPSQDTITSDSISRISFLGNNSGPFCMKEVTFDWNHSLYHLTETLQLKKMMLGESDKDQVKLQFNSRTTGNKLPS